MLAKLRTSQCAIEADIADLGLKRLMSVASTRAAFSEEDLAAIEVSTRALKNTTQVASKTKKPRASTPAVYCLKRTCFIRPDRGPNSRQAQAHTSVFSAMSPPRLSDSSEGEEL